MATKKKADPKASAKAATKAAAKTTRKAAPRGPWNTRWIGREIAVTLMDDSVVLGVLREVDDWALCLEHTEEPGAESIIPRDGIAYLEYSPAGYADWLEDDLDEEIVTADSAQ